MRCLMGLAPKGQNGGVRETLFLIFGVAATATGPLGALFGMGTAYTAVSPPLRPDKVEDYTGGDGRQQNNQDNINHYYFPTADSAATFL